VTNPTNSVTCHDIAANRRSLLLSGALSAIFAPISQVTDQRASARRPGSASRTRQW
jgi:hypothetical protein